MDADKLKDILDDHHKWLNDEGGKKADLHRADLSGCSLAGADLRGANLINTNLSDATLTNADLSGADLSWSNLTNANLTGADLSWARLSLSHLDSANLTNANLTGADLTGANLRKAKFAEIKTDIWTIQIHSTTVRIGCLNHTYEEWMSFTDDEISAMDARALDWWRAWKPVIATVIENVKAQDKQGGVARDP